MPKKLTQAGVEVTPLRVLATTNHHYAPLNALADTPATRATVQIVSDKLSEALSTKTRAGVNLERAAE